MEKTNINQQAHPLPKILRELKNILLRIFSFTFISLIKKQKRPKRACIILPLTGLTIISVLWDVMKLKTKGPYLQKYQLRSSHLCKGCFLWCWRSSWEKGLSLNIPIEKSKLKHSRHNFSINQILIIREYSIPALSLSSMLTEISTIVKSPHKLL